VKDRLNTLKTWLVHQLALSRFTERGKVHFLLITGFALSVIGIFTGWLVFLWFGIFLVYGVYLHYWIEWDPGNPCPGPRHAFTSPTGQVGFGVCQGCDSWQLVIRGEGVGDGTGTKSLIDRLRRLQQTWERNVPEVAGELRGLADVIEGQEFKSLRTEDFDAERFAKAMGLTDADTAMEKMAKELAETYGDQPAVLVPAKDYEQYLAWKGETEEGGNGGGTPGPSGA
jgi:hypothetical protein